MKPTISTAQAHGALEKLSKEFSIARKNWPIGKTVITPIHAPTKQDKDRIIEVTVFVTPIKKRGRPRKASLHPDEVVHKAAKRAVRKPTKATSKPSPRKAAKKPAKAPVKPARKAPASKNAALIKSRIRTGKTGGVSLSTDAKPAKRKGAAPKKRKSFPVRKG